MRLSAVKRHRSKSFTVRQWDRVSWDAVCLDLLQSEWGPLYQAVTIDDKLEAFLDILIHVLDVHCPAKTIVSRRPRCPLDE